MQIKPYLLIGFFFCLIATFACYGLEAQSAALPIHCGSCESESDSSCEGSKEEKSESCEEKDKDKDEGEGKKEGEHKEDN